MNRNSEEEKKTRFDHLEDAFFPVDLQPIAFDRIDEEEHVRGVYLESDDLFPVYEKRKIPKRIPGFYAVTRMDTKRVFAVVSDKYRLITNQEAYYLGQQCFMRVFGRNNTDDMEFYNLRMPTSKGSCTMDFFAKNENVYLGGDPGNGDEEWRVFLRIINSYNRTTPIKFEIGFCRDICKNGLIFGERSIEFKYNHNQRSDRIKADFSMKYESMLKIKQLFQSHIDYLYRQKMREIDFLPQIKSVLQLREPARRNEDEEAKYLKLEHHLLYLIRKYREEHGDNAYALLNILTDFASHPQLTLSPLESNENVLEHRVGNWLLDQGIC